ncbi:MAG: L,D-transpeptidase family protein [Gammaproteobacteria bacterium]|nr:L,D-transpeptidase family protein [Gammaproteobacteria bacterium]
MRKLLFPLLMMPVFAFASMKPVDRVEVYKSKSLMQLKRNGRVVKNYKVVFGGRPKGHKRFQGDQRTPEGLYKLNYKKADSKFYRAIQVSYPNQADRAYAAKHGKSPGGNIMIHGHKPKWKGLKGYLTRNNWTEGCIAVTNEEMDEIWALVKVGVPIEIFP